MRGIVTLGDYHVVRIGRDGRVDDGFCGGSKDLMLRIQDLKRQMIIRQ